MKIALLGAESTGKTVLAQQLADHLRGQGDSVTLIPEVLREWCQREARTLAADMLILDLEDAVKPEDKAVAREAAVAAVAEGFGDKPVAIRVNGLGSIWHEADIAMISDSDWTSRNRSWMPRSSMSMMLSKITIASMIFSASSGSLERRFSMMIASAPAPTWFRISAAARTPPTSERLTRPPLATSFSSA